jgi:hypothetical protein
LTGADFRPIIASKGPALSWRREQTMHTKADTAAIELFGRVAYAGIPKSVFAVAAYYLADACSETGVGNGEAIQRLREELRCLSGQVIDPKQASRSLSALAHAEEAR